MSYTPKSEEQLAKEGLLENGQYDFEVFDTSDKPSKAGNAMATLKLHVYGPDGDANIIWDYIAFGNNFGERKWRHAAAACGLIKEYEAGTLTSSDFKGKSGKCEVKIQEGNKEFPLPKNQITDYIARSVPESVETGALPPEKAKSASPLDDEIPF